MLCREKKKGKEKRHEWLRGRHAAAQTQHRKVSLQTLGRPIQIQNTCSYNGLKKKTFLNLYAFGCRESFKYAAVHERINVYKENYLLQPGGPGGSQCTATTQQQNVDSLLNVTSFRSTGCKWHIFCHFHLFESWPVLSRSSAAAAALFANQRET